LLYAVAKKAEDVQVYYHAAELREENPEVMEAETLESNSLAAVSR
jgi:hypothetical protein